MTEIRRSWKKDDNDVGDLVDVATGEVLGDVRILGGAGEVDDDVGGLVDVVMNRKTLKMSESLAELEKSAATKVLEKLKTMLKTL